MLNQITVDTGTTNPHIFATMDALTNSSSFGQDGVSQASCVESTPTAVSILARVFIQGRFGYTEESLNEIVTIPTGNAGYSRKDLIVARLTRVGGLDYMGIVNLVGTPVVGSPIAKTPTKQDMFNGGTIREIPLFEVELNGLTITTITSVYSQIPSLQLLNFGDSTRSETYQGWDRTVTLLGNKMLHTAKISTTVNLTASSQSGVYQYEGSVNLFHSTLYGELFTVSGTEFAKVSCQSGGTVSSQIRSLAYDTGDLVVNFRLVTKAALSNLPVTLYVAAEYIVI